MSASPGAPACWRARFPWYNHLSQHRPSLIRAGFQLNGVMSLIKTGGRTAKFSLLLVVLWISLQNIAYLQSTVANTIAEHLQLARKAQEQGEGVRATSEFQIGRAHV